MWFLFKFLLVALPVLAHGEPSLIISVPARDFVVGEPIPITFSYENATDDSVEMRYPLDYEWGLDVVITRPDGQKFNYVSPAHAFAATALRANPERKTLQPGEAVTTERFVSYQVPLSDFALVATGAYTLEARFPYEQGVYSNPVNVTVREPEGNDRQALIYIKDKKLEALLTPDARRWGTSDGQIAALQELASSGKCIVGSCSPGTFDLGPNHYARYAVLALRSLGHDTGDPPLEPSPSPSRGEGGGEGGEGEGGPAVAVTLAIIIILIGIAIAVIWFRFRMTKE